MSRVLDDARNVCACMSRVLDDAGYVFAYMYVQMLVPACACFSPTLS